MKAVAFYTLGCKLNFSETSTISRQFEERGFQKVPFDSAADVFVINTCSVTENADKKCRKVVKEARKQNPKATVLIIGCYAQLKPKEIAEIPGVDAVLGAAEKFQLLDILEDFEPKEQAQIHVSEVEEAKTYVPGFSYGDRTRTFLKVQDGCNYHCSFCTIPLARGNSRSASIESVVEQAQKIAQTEVKEVVLTGVNIGDFGIQNGKRKERFIDLVRALDEVEGIERFRISSIEPNLLKNEIIEFVAASKRFMPHFHIPLQSGSDEILKGMRRRYRSDLYANRVAKIKELMPHACIGVDVIVGFPGETEAHFEETYAFLNELDIAYLHVFPYSERDNTHALNLDGVVYEHVRKERAKRLRILSQKKRRYFYESQLGSVRSVLFEADSKEGQMEGFTDNYVRVTAPYDPLLVNDCTDLRLQSITSKNRVAVEEPNIEHVELPSV